LRGRRHFKVEGDSEAVRLFESCRDALLNTITQENFDKVSDPQDLEDTEAMFQLASFEYCPLGLCGKNDGKQRRQNSDRACTRSSGRFFDQPFPVRHARLVAAQL
jgi:hypothetical protein